jgi:hypothetical protein
VRGIILTVFVLFCPLGAGCLAVPEDICSESECFPLDSAALSELLASPGAFDVLSYAEDFERLRVETSTVYGNQGQFAEIHWSVAKDDTANLRSIAMRFTVSTSSMDSEVIEGQHTTNIRVGGDWYEGRDAIPQYADPFAELAQLANEQPEGMWPPFGFDVASIAELDWTISGDTLSLQQIATASNATHTIIVELMGAPPMVTGIETYSGDEEQFTLRVTTGDDVVITLQEGLPRTPVEFSLDAEPIQVGDTTVWSGPVPSGMDSDIEPFELEFHGISEEEGLAVSVAMMQLDQGTSNTTLDDGTWWEFTWIDFLSPGYFSHSDLYHIRTNATGQLSVALYDSWAQQWTSGPLQGA